MPLVPTSVRRPLLGACLLGAVAVAAATPPADAATAAPTSPVVPAAPAVRSATPPVTDPWTLSPTPLDDLHEREVTVRGTVRDEGGAPIPGAQIRVSTSTVTEFGFGTLGSKEWSTRTDEHGRWVIEGVNPSVRVPWFDVAGSQLFVTVDDPEITMTYDGDLGKALRTAATDGTGVVERDAVARRADARLSGRITVAGRTDPGAIQVKVVGDTSGFATVSPDGSWEMAVRSGTYAVEAQSVFGLPRRWPDIPVPTGVQRHFGRNIQVGYRQQRTGIDVQLRPRRAYAAMDETGVWQPGYASAYPREDLTELCYEPQPRPVGALSVAPVLGRVTNQRGTFPGLRQNEFFGQFPIQVELRNDGDAPIRLMDVRFEGPDASRFAMRTDGALFCARPMLHPSNGLQLVDIPVPLPMPKRELRVTVVFPGSGGRDLRVPLVVLDANARNADGSLVYADRLAAPGVDGTSGQSGKPPKRGTAPTLAGLQLTARKLAVHFPAAGEATVRFARRAVARSRGRARATWRTVRTLRVRSTRSGDRRVGMPRLRAGRYRVTLTSRIGTQPARSLVLYHRIGRR